MKSKYIIISIIFLVALVVIVTDKIIEANKEINMSVVGDILLSRGVGDKIKEEGYEYPYEHVKDIFKDKDIVFGNLECPICDESNPVYKKPQIVFKADSSNTIALKEAGFNILSLANNHTMDQNSIGLISTMNLLNKTNIGYVGAGKSYGNARKPYFVKMNNTVIGFLAYSVFPPEGYIFSPSRPDVARVDFDKLDKEIQMARENCDFLVLSFHWGNEYEFYPSEYQRELAYKAVDSGADLILGHHPHVLQGIENYRDKYIFYSLGNFIFDRQIQSGTDETIIVDLVISDSKIKKITLHPIEIEDCQPTLARDNKAGYILNRLKKYSEEMDVVIHIDNNIGIIQISD